MAKYKFVYDKPQMYSPSIQTINGKTYLMPGWHEFPNGTTINDIDITWEKFRAAKKAVVAEYKSSKGEVTYQVTKSENGDLECTCPGFRYRNRNCKHIRKTREKETIA